MLIFALDSTTPVATVAVCRDETPLASDTQSNGNTHSQTLLPMAQKLLRGLSLRADDIDLFATTVGPGSFTGVRIGVATVKGLAFDRGKPCVGVSSLEALAYNLIDEEALLCPVIHARQFVYCALFRARAGKLTRLCEDTICRILPPAQSEVEETLRRVLDALPAEDRELPIYLLGDGAAAIQPRLSPLLPTLHLAPEERRELNACAVARLAHRTYLDGHSCTDAALAPVYLRPCQAEQDRLARLQSEGK